MHETTPYFNIVGQNISKFRRQRGWTREELALKLKLLGCNITPQILSHIETRRYIVTDMQIVFFSEVFSVSIRDLFSSISERKN
jgi:transcriptional regulator with XRE-family HTH domain